MWSSGSTCCGRASRPSKGLLGSPQQPGRPGQVWAGEGTPGPCMPLPPLRTDAALDPRAPQQRPGTATLPIRAGLSVLRSREGHRRPPQPGGSQGPWGLCTVGRAGRAPRASICSHQDVPASTAGLAIAGQVPGVAV